MSGGGKKGGGSTIRSERTSLANPIIHYRERTGSYPSNSQIWWAFKRPVEVGTDRPPKTYLEVFDPSLRHQIYTGNSPAPRGHYILNAFHKNRSGASGVPGLPVQSSGGARPSAIAFFAGRVFYAGVQSAGFNTHIYFSQVLERADQVAHCYQLQDPTHEDLRDLLPTDGGVIVIPEIAEVHHMQAVGQDLFAFASNGVWRISGSEGIGFRANDFSVSKVSGTPSISNLSFVDVEGIPMWWNRSGIHALVMEDIATVRVQNLTEQTIKTAFIGEIPHESKFWAKGTYDPLTRYVQWLYRSTPIEDLDDRFDYDRVLVLNTQTGAFFPPWTISPHPRVSVRGIFSVEGYSVEQDIVTVLVEDDEVFAGSDQVLSIVEDRRPVESKVKYIVNILGDEEGLDPEPDDGAPPDSADVFVLSDPVLAGANTVVVTF